MKDKTHPKMAVLFDLDGTLCDTALDLMSALNHALEQHGYPLITLTQAKTQISFGARAMVRFALERVDPSLATNETLLEQITQEMLAYYNEHPAWHTRLFPGIEHLLTKLALHHIPWGVVTNKPQSFSDQIISRLGLTYPPRCVIGGDRLTVNKPDPAPLLLAAELCTVPANRCIYVGDHSRDVVAAKAAGMIAIAVSYGYLSLEDTPQTWEAEILADSPRTLLYAIEEKIFDMTDE